MKKILLNVIPCIIIPFSATAQTSETETKEESFVEWLITPSIPEVNLEIKNYNNYNKLPQGARIWGGATPLTNWDAKCMPSDSENPLQNISTRFTSAPYSSKTVVLVGDFLIEENLETKKKELRAKFLIFDNSSKENRKYRFILVNGIPEQEIIFSVGENNLKTLLPMEHFEYISITPIVNCSVKCGDAEFDLFFKFDGSEKSAMASFYLKDGVPQYRAIKMESY